MKHKKKTGYFNTRGDAFIAGDGTRITELDGKPVRELRFAARFSLSEGNLTPAEWELLCSLDQLRSLDLSGTKISALPDSIGQLTALQSLSLIGTKISALPDSIGQLAALQCLDLRSTNISALPDSIGQLAALQRLDLRGTSISALPDSIGQLAALQSLNLRGTKISALPDSIGQLTELQRLDLRFTNISALPDSIGQLTELQRLDLRFTNISALPDSIGQLAKLRSLDLSGTNISALPDSIGQLAKLQSLYLLRTSIFALPDSIGQLAELQGLYLSNTNISALPDSIGQLTELQSLYLNGTSISALPDSIGQLAKLRSLDLSGTKISALPDSIGQLTALQSLNLSDTKISALPDSIGQLTALQRLGLSDTKISALPDSIWQLAALQRLDLSGTNISALPDSIWQLAALQRLGLIGTKISALPDSIGQLAKLQILDLSGTKIAELPPALLERDPVFARNLDELVKHLRSEQDRLMIRLDDVRLANPLILDAIRQGMTGKEIRERFYGEARSRRRLRECKVIFLGDGAVGKTTTIRRICGDDKLIGVKETPGIEIRSATLNPDGSVGDRGDPKGIRVHFWDFGGQDVLRSMHRCFLTERTVYVIVSNARQTNHSLRQDQAVYWLNSIRDFAQDRDSEGGRPSRVLLLMNCQENDVDRFDLNELRERFSGCSNLQFAGDGCNQALDVVKAGDDAIQNLVRQIYLAAQGYVDEYPLPWFRLRDSLERETEGKNYLDAERYRTLCERWGVTEGEREALLGILVDIGVVFRSRQKPKLADDYMVLRPIWLVNAIYAIIRSADPRGPIIPGAGPRAGEYADRNGVFSIGELAILLKNHKAFSTLDPKTKTYGADEVYYVMDVMVQYGLAARIESDKTEKYFIPMLCATDRPSRLPELGNLQLEYRFDYGDSSSQNLFYRLMVQLYPDFRGPFWQNGCDVDVDGTPVRITRKPDQNNEQIRISVYGEAKAAARDALDLLRGLIAAENRRKGLHPEEYLTQDGLKAAGYGPGDDLSVSALLHAYREGDKEFRIPGGSKQTVQELLAACLGQTDRSIYRLTNGALTTPEGLDGFVFGAVSSAGYGDEAGFAFQKARLFCEAMKRAVEGLTPSLSYQKAQAKAVLDWFAKTPEDEQDAMRAFLRSNMEKLSRKTPPEGGDFRD